MVSLLTSTYACEHGVTVDGLALHPNIPTLAERLAHAGYATASLHANAYAGSLSGLDRGFAVSELLPHIEGDQVEAGLAVKVRPRRTGNCHDDDFVITIGLLEVTIVDELNRILRIPDVQRIGDG